MLFVHDGQPQVVKHHILLKHRMRAHQHVDIATRQRRQFGGPFFALVAPRQDFDHNARVFRQGLKAFEMLPRKDFRRRHHDALPSSLDRDQQRHEGHQRFARAYIPLQKPVHPLRRGQISGDILHRAFLCTRRPIRQCCQNLGSQPPVSYGRPPRAGLSRGPCNRKRQLMGHELIISQPPADR